MTLTTCKETQDVDVWNGEAWLLFSPSVDVVATRNGKGYFCINCAAAREYDMSFCEIERLHVSKHTGFRRGRGGLDRQGFRLCGATGTVRAVAVAAACCYVSGDTARMGSFNRGLHLLVVVV